MAEVLRRVFRLAESDRGSGVRRLIADRVDAQQLAEGRTTIVATVTRTGDFYDHRYGNFSITKEMLLSMIRNFDANSYGQLIMLDAAHQPQNGSAGVFKRLFLDGNKLRAEIELTPYGVESIKQKGMIYLSAEFADNYIGNEEPRREFGPTLLGAALTPRPVIKHLDPIQLSDTALDGAPPTYLSDRITQYLAQENLTMWEKLKKQLAAKLGSMKLAEAVVADMVKQFAEMGESLGITDAAAADKLLASFESMGKQLAEKIGSNPATVQLSMPSVGLTPEDVKKLLADDRAAQDLATKQLAETKDAKVKRFTDAINGAEGLKALSEDQRGKLLSMSDMITADMTDEQIDKLALHQITLGNDMAINARLGGMGYTVAGSPRITVDDSNSIKALQEAVDRRLGIEGNATRFSKTGGKLQETNKQFAEKVLAEFDAQNGARLHAEHKMLAGGTGVTSDAAVPVSWIRTVIREALYNMVGLNFVNADSASFASTIEIPYSYRDQSAASRGSTRVYERKAIQRAGMIQTSDTAYTLPQKLSFQISDELNLLTSSGVLDYNALAENQRNAARIIGEDTDQLILNEILQAADEYLPVAIAGEALAAVDGVHTVFPLAHFPVVRPRSIYDLKGNQIGNTTTPVAVTYAGAAINAYDGSGTQAAGTYFDLDYNNGMIHFVDETGALVVPPNATAIAVNYSYVTNVSLFDTDVGTDPVDLHWDGALRAYGLRKTVIEDDRYHMANFGLMSGTAMTNLEQAKQFSANSKRPGTDLNADGSLGSVKDVPNFKGFGPGLWMSDQRIIIGEKGSTRLRMMKTWSMSEMEEARDTSGNFIGAKEAWGSQYIALKTPEPLKRAYTSILLYSSAARAVA